MAKKIFSLPCSKLWAEFWNHLYHQHLGMLKNSGSIGCIGLIRRTPLAGLIRNFVLILVVVINVHVSGLWSASRRPAWKRIKNKEISFQARKDTGEELPVVYQQDNIESGRCKRKSKSARAAATWEVGHGRQSALRVRTPRWKSCPSLWMAHPNQSIVRPSIWRRPFFAPSTERPEVLWKLRRVSFVEPKVTAKELP